ncbi:MAG TPA: LysM peptidoglycan-binding domain-containing protein [Anaerolineae bacterium]|nr:LysM peptidoglycan-binding domain-containing protein [Anaerolineae bacterium]
MRRLPTVLSVGVPLGSHWRCLVALLAFLYLAYQTPSLVHGSPHRVETTTYVVGWGDTLSSIAGRYGTSVSAIALANGMSNPNLIYVGQRLSIPGTSAAPTGGSGVYVVQRGDTLSAIAGRFQTTVQNLVQMNGLSNPNLIAVGQRLAVPAGQPANASPTSTPQTTAYVVQRGDTLLGIAARFQVNMWDIVLANNIANPSLIYVGQSLTIPGGRGSENQPTSPTPTVKPVVTPQPGAPTPTPRPAVPTQGPSYAFRYVQGSMRQYPNCGAVYFKGRVTGIGGEPVNGKTLRLRFAGQTVYRVSGEGQDPGEWSFAPLSGENYHTPFTFLIDMVQSESSPAAQSDVLEIRFADCGAAGQFDSIRFEYAGGSTGPVATPTRAAERTPTPTAASNTVLPPVEWDPRLNQLPCVRMVTVAQKGVRLQPGDRYWRLVKARWLNEEESRGDIQIYVDLLDEAGQRVFGQRVAFENGGRYSVVSERQSCCYPWDYPVKWPMYSPLCAYSAYVEGLPSDVVAGMGLGTPEHPTWTIHTGFVLTFQRIVYR